MKTMRLDSPTGTTGTCGYEAYRGRLFIVLESGCNGERLQCEIPLGEMASRCQLSGKVLDAARARWEVANIAKPESPEAAERRRKRDREHKRAKRHGVQGAPVEPPEETAVLVTAAAKLGFPEEW